MPKMASLSLLLILILSLLHNLSGSTVQILSLHNSSPETLQTLSNTGANIAVYVSNTHLNTVSSTVLNAEKWVKTHILAHYPSKKITTIVVGQNVLCNNQTLFHVASSVLPAMENLHHSLTRWGLQSKIEVSPVFSSNCFSLNHYYSQKIIKPMLHFLQNNNYSYSINPSPTETPLFSVSSHLEWVSKLGFSSLGKINLLKISAIESKPINLRRLSSLGIDSFPSRLTLLSPNHSPVSKLGFSNLGKIDILKIKEKYSKPINFRRLSSMGVDPFPPRPIPLSPTQSPVSIGPHITLSPKPSVKHEYPHLPPCNPSPNPSFSPSLSPSFSPSFSPVAPSPGPMTWQTWCVAKPSVPAETLQEAMDYACGEGGADCDAIGPKGSCYYPDTVVAHASYAFNSYWQKSKGNGGTCAFGGTAMLINTETPLFSVSSHLEWVSKLGFSSLGKINLLKISAIESKPINLRRLSSLGIDSFPSRLTLLSPNHSPVSKLGFSNLGKIDILKIKEKYSKPINFRRLSSMGVDPFPPRPIPLSPTQSPVSIGPHITLSPKPSVKHEYPHLPPCNPSPNPSFSPSLSPSFSPSFSPVAPSPGPMTWQTWCVAKPSVPAETLQEAMDYACGEGGADCDAIGPKGSCYYPDTVVAHASYAFNSYWQKSKGNGGTCAFGGTAMLINADPSYSHCQFVLA